MTAVSGTVASVCLQYLRMGLSGYDKLGLYKNDSHKLNIIIMKALIKQKLPTDRKDIQDWQGWYVSDRTARF